MSAAGWKRERSAFLAAREGEISGARQRLALQILCGEDLGAVLMLDNAKKERMCKRLKRLIERELLKGAKGHWSYDLNRHIGLKQALETLRRRFQMAARGPDALALPERKTAPRGAVWSLWRLYEGRRSGGLLALAAKTHVLRQARTRCGIVWSNHRIGRIEIPLFAILFRGKAVVGHEMTLQ